MAKIKDKEALVDILRNSKVLSAEQKSELIGLLREQKTYGLVWEDSKEEAWEQLKTEIPVLQEDTTKRIDHGEDYPNHILIEGDNIHALEDLLYTHEGKVDVIFIDPPYNTGHNDFSYNDTYIGKDDAFRHSQWLSFMYKRLMMAKTLLSDKGMIFITIGDDEIAQLKMLCNEIFEEYNLVSDIIWQSRKSVSNDTFVSLNHNYILSYAKNIDNWDKMEFRLPSSSEKFSNPDNDPRGAWVADPFDAPNIRPNLTYPILNPNTGKTYLPPAGRCWRTTQDEYLRFYKENRIVFGKKGTSKPQLKRFLSEALDKGQTPISIWNDISTTTNGTQHLISILGDKKFSNPKPVDLIMRIIELGGTKNSMILDFFAGSGTTMEAVIQQNVKDGGHRQCILVTNNENNICEEVTYERNRRVIEGYTTPKGEQVEGLKNNNLRYYKVGFVPRIASHQAKREQMFTMTDLLCIKENIYKEQERFGSLDLAGKQQFIRYFEEQGRRMLLIYDTSVLPFVVKELEQMTVEEPVKVYIFADGGYPYTSDFEEVISKVSLIPLPYAMNHALRFAMPEQENEKLEGKPENTEEDD